MIRAVLFDAAGTLIYLPRGVGWHYREVAARHGITLEENHVGTAFRQAFKAAAPRVARPRGNANPPIGTPPPPIVSRPDDDKLWWRALVRQILSACGETPADSVFNTLFEELYARFAEPGVWALYPEAPAVLETLYSRYRLGILSNFDRRLYPVLDHLGVRQYFEAIIISSELGVDKPDPRMFAAAVSALGVLPQETIHAGDDPEQDWRAAEAAGLHVYRVERPSRGLEALPDHVRRLESIAPPTPATM
jgi:putative hydrolase of the HAD superfamily